MFISDLEDRSLLFSIEGLRVRLIFMNTELKQSFGSNFELTQSSVAVQISLQQNFDPICPAIHVHDEECAGYGQVEVVFEIDTKIFSSRDSYTFVRNSGSSGEWEDLGGIFSYINDGSVIIGKVSVLHFCNIAPVCDKSLSIAFHHLEENDGLPAQSYFRSHHDS